MLARFPRRMLPGRAAIVLAALLAFAAVGASLVQRGASQTAAPPAPAAQPGSFKPTEAQWKSLQIAPVDKRVFRPERVTEGNIAIDDDLNTPVFSPYSGRVTRLIAKLGDSVAAGAPLFTVEATEFVQAANDLIAAVAALRTARAQLVQAEINEKRAHELYNTKGGALKDWQQAQTDLMAAQNAVRTADIALAAVRNRLRILDKNDKEISALEAQPTQKLEPVATVTAPIPGIVTQRQVGLGQYIQSVSSGASTPIYTIGDLSTVWLIANVREADAGLMRLGARVEVRVLAYPDRVFKARITWIASAVDQNTHRLPVRTEIENPDFALRPNMFASFSIMTGAEASALAVPQRAVVYEGDQARVWVAGDDRSLSLREIKTGRTSDGMVEVLTGLAAGEKVVTRGALFIDRAGGLS
jgi:cobalt-zinc-cadmium efflux system membrane fusion protein